MPYLVLFQELSGGGDAFSFPFTAGFVCALLLLAGAARLFLFLRPVVKARANAEFRIGAVISVLVIALTLSFPFAPLKTGLVTAGSIAQFAGFLAFEFFLILLLFKQYFLFWGRVKLLPFLLPVLAAAILPLSGAADASFALGAFSLLLLLLSVLLLILAVKGRRYWKPFLCGGLIYLVLACVFFIPPDIGGFLWALPLFAYIFLEYGFFAGEEEYSAAKAVKKRTEDIEENQVFFADEEGAELAEAVAAQGSMRIAPFVPKEFLSILNKDSVEELKLGDHIQQEMTIFFSDIRQFTDLSEKLTPEESFAFINSYLSRIVPEITKNQGFVDKYIGDAILALFPQQDGADKAVQAAIDIQEKIREYNGHRANCGYRALSIGIGLHTGPLMVGVVGVENRMQNTVISDAVNLTSRLESITKVFGVSLAISEETFKRLSDPGSYKYRFIGKVRVKGKSAPVSVFEIFNGIDPVIQERKIKANMFFEQGMFHYYQKNYAEALMNFRKVREVLPDDGASAFYMDNCLAKLKSL